MTSADLTEPASVAERFVAAWNDQDADKLAELFTADASFVNVVGLWWTSRRPIRYNHAYGFERMFPRSTMTLGRITTRLLGDDAAVVVTGWHLTGQTGPDGSRGGDRRGVFTFTVVRQPDGQWLAVHAHNTDRAPDSQTHLVTEDGHHPASYE